MKEYTTVNKAEVYTEIINKSKFIANITRADTAEEAAEFIQKISKTYYDATHNCYAYIVGDSAKFSDNGEPSGTAGLPIYETIKKQNLDHVCVVVTRYFGGIKLGAGGLVRAYGGCAANALAAAERVKICLITPFIVTLPYNMLKQTKAEIELRAKIISIEYGENVLMHINALSREAKEIADKIIDFTAGRAGIIFSPEFLGEY
ncbi:MAG TPA: YigZ family protein [Clostridia bacterium]|nr:YigZ family protein [Clostridia bacterium]